jgi:hypothetical protein
MPLAQALSALGRACPCKGPHARTPSRLALGLNRWRGARPQANGFGPMGQGSRGDYLESPLRTGSGSSSYPERRAVRPYPDTDASSAARPHPGSDPGRAKGGASRAAAAWIERSLVRAAVSESSEEQVRVEPSDTAQPGHCWSHRVSLTHIF